MTAIRVGICSLLAFAVLTDGGVPDWSTAVLEIGAALLFILWSFVTARQRQIDVRLNWLYLPVLGLIALCLTQKLFGLSAYPYATKIELLKWIAYFALAFLAVEVFRGGAQLKAFSVFLVSLGFLVALFAIAQHYTFNGKLYWFVPLPQSSEPFGPFVDRDHFAGFIELTTPFGLAMLFHRTWRGEKAALVALLTAVPIAALVLCGSRGGIAGSAFASLFLILVLQSRDIKIRQLLAFASLIILCGALVFWLGASATIQRFEALTASGISRSQRISMDRDTFRIFRNHYTTGTGLGTLETVFPQYETTYTGRVVDHAHNDYLELLAETGVIGGLLGLAFIVLLFRQGFANLNARERQSDRVFYAGALAACSALLVHSFVDFNLHVPSNACLFLLLATLASAGKQSHDPWNAKPTGQNWQAEKSEELNRGIIRRVARLRKLGNASRSCCLGRSHECNRQRFQLAAPLFPRSSGAKLLPCRSFPSPQARDFADPAVHVSTSALANAPESRCRASSSVRANDLALQSESHNSEKRRVGQTHRNAADVVLKCPASLPDTKRQFHADARSISKDS
jgi:O-antigen ligase